MLEDPSKLVRWRAARILGELTGTQPHPDDNIATAAMSSTAIATATKALETALTVDGQSFEVPTTTPSPLPPPPLSLISEF